MADNAPFKLRPVPKDRIARNVWVARNRRVAYCYEHATNGRHGAWSDFERLWFSRIFQCTGCGARRRLV